MRFLDRYVPGAAFAPSTGYLSVGSRFVTPTIPGPTAPRWRRLAGRVFEELGTAMLGAWERGTPGDGIVPYPAVHLDGARQLTFDDVLHGHIGGPWYADDEIVERWWPVAVDVWRTAIAARAGVSSDAREAAGAVTADAALAAVR
jgi:hypothetical protein